MKRLMQSLAVVVCALITVAMLSQPAVAEATEATEVAVLEVELGAPFRDGAVLQRQMPVPVWGWAKPGTEATVTFAGQRNSAKAGADGKWVVTLDALKASAQPSEMVITLASGESVTLKDILVGEVWIASGQSNMQWLASKSDVGRVLQAGIAERVEAGEETEPIIREAKVTDVFSALHPIEKAQGEWIDNGADMSAVAYAFAYELWKELNIPIGIVNCSFSSTAIEAWTPREGFANSKHPYTQSIYQKLLESDPSTPEHKVAWDTFYSDINTAIKENKARLEKGEPAEPIKIDTPGNLSSNRDASWLYNARMHPMVTYAVRGAIWNQGYANSGNGLEYYPNLHSLVRGWRMVWQRPDLPVYFHQFYSAGKEGGTPPGVSFGSVAEMRLGTTMARDIPNTGMASQIDIGGSVHYYRKALPGQRLALHALKNQYGKDIVANGPFFKSYEVKGNKMTVSFDHAHGGLFVGQIETDSHMPATVVEVENGDSQLALFYLVGEDRVWHQANAKIVGDKVELTAPGVAKPRGVSYGTPGIGFQPNVYNKAKLPLTPFSVYDDSIVIRANWPDDPPKIAGVEPDPNAGGLANDFRKMPLLSTQFRDNAVLQHGKPITIWGSVIHDWGVDYHRDLIGDRKPTVKFSFGEIEKTIAVTPDMREWSVTLDPMPPSDKPRTLTAQYYLDDELIHERVAQNVVVGDVWFIAAPAVKMDLPKIEKGEGIVRVMERKAKRDRFPKASRFSIAVSTTPGNRFASEWLDADAKSLAGHLAYRIAAKVDHPVGIIFMQSEVNKNQDNPPLKSWLPFEAMADVPSLAEDYRILGASYPGSPSYNANLQRYMKDWQAYWSDYIPAMIDDKRVPDGSAWGVIPSKAPKDETSEATLTYNVMVHSFTPTAVKGILFLVGQEITQDASYEEQRQVLESSWRKRFGGQPPMMLVPVKDDLEQLQKVIDVAAQ